MTQLGVGDTTEVCEECGAVVGDRERHARGKNAWPRSCQTRTSRRRSR
jgi:hypothetical protein